MNGYLADASFLEVLLRVAVVLVGFAITIGLLALLLDFLQRAAERHERLEEWRRQVGSLPSWSELEDEWQ